MADYVFQLVQFEQLSTTQQAAIMDDNAIALSGGPGTGKSMVSLWRHILNHRRETPVNSQLLTFHKLPEFKEDYQPGPAIV